MDELRIEDLMPFFVAENGEIRITPSDKIGRVNINNERYYFLRGKGVATRLLPSVTTFLSRWIPKPAHLEKWIRESGEAGIAHRDRRASYGTCMHVLIERLVKAGYNLEKGAPRAAAYEFIGQDATEEEIGDLEMDLCAFAVWAKAHDLFVVALEVPLYSENLGISGMTDLVGIITVKEGKETHRINCLIDFKSGRKGFQETHAFQLHIYRDMWNEMYGDVFAVNRVFNWSPKEWKKAPTCHFEEQTSDELDALLSHLYAMEKIRPMQPKKSVFSFSGIQDGEPVYAKTDVIDLIIVAQKDAADEIAEDIMFDAIFPVIEADFLAAAASETTEPVIAPPVDETPAKQAVTMNQLIEAAHRLNGFAYKERNESGEYETVLPTLDAVHKRASLSSGAKSYCPVISQKAINIYCTPIGFWEVSAAKKTKTGLSELQAVEYILASKDFTALKDALQAPAVASDIHPNQLPLF